MSDLRHHLPHGAEALLVHRVLTRNAGSAEVSCHIPDDNPFLFPGPGGALRAPTALLLDFAAQAAAALHTTPTASNGLVALFEDVHCSSADFDPTRELVARVRELRVLPPLAYYSFEIGPASNGEFWLTGKLSLRL